MNYSYPNYYSSYSGNPYMPAYGQYNGSYQSQQIQQNAPPLQQNNQQMPQPMPQAQMQIPSITGKFVESADIVKISECPIGGYSVFPLNDFSQVYIKAYDKNGNLQTLTYNLSKDSEVPKKDTYADRLDAISESIAKLDKKIDGFKSSSPISTRKKKAEVDEDDE